MDISFRVTCTEIFSGSRCTQIVTLAESSASTVRTETSSTNTTTLLIPIILSVSILAVIILCCTIIGTFVLCLKKKRFSHKHDIPTIELKDYSSAQVDAEVCHHNAETVLGSSNEEVSMYCTGQL